MMRGEGGDHVSGRADGRRISTQGNYSLIFNGLVNRMLVGEELVPILFRLKPKGVARGPCPHKAIGFGRTATGRPVNNDFSASNTPAVRYHLLAGRISNCSRKTY